VFGVTAHRSGKAAGGRRRFPEQHQRAAGVFVPQV